MTDEPPEQLEEAIGPGVTPDGGDTDDDLLDPPSLPGPSGDDQ